VASKCSGAICCNNAVYIFIRLLDIVSWFPLQQTMKTLQLALPHDTNR
jgi:hypothetical protein